MARKARLKLANAIYHIYQHGMYEINLFNDDQDKEYFLYLIKKYKCIYKVKIFAYCIMTTHYHILINPNCADISKVMHSINQCYAQYYNKKYKRKGHVFSSRFESKIARDNKGILIMSAYIHNNPKDIENYTNRVEEYPFSSFGIYANRFRDKYQIIDQEFLLNYYYRGNDFYKNINKAKETYYRFIKKLYPSYYDNFSFNKLGSEDIIVPEIKNNLDINENSFEINNSFNKDRFDDIKRDMDPAKIIDKLSKHPYFTKKDTTYKSICIFIIRCLSNISYYDASVYFNNISPSYLSRLCSKGYDLINNNADYEKIIDSFIC